MAEFDESKTAHAFNQTLFSYLRNASDFIIRSMADVENLFGSDAESEGNLHSFQRMFIRLRYLFDRPNC